MQKFERDVINCTRNALNRTLTQVAKEQRRLIKQEYALTDKKIRKLTNIHRATINNLQGSIKALKVQLSLNNFTKIESKKGARVKISKQENIMFKGAFLGAREGNKKQKNKGFLVLKDKSEANKFEVKESTIYSYKNRKTPKAKKVYYLRTKPFSKIALNHTPALQKKAIEIFKNELDKE